MSRVTVLRLEGESAAYETKLAYTDADLQRILPPTEAKAVITTKEYVAERNGSKTN